jgi:phosphoglycerol transferase MdoB-like AlkP superfamily enzyme
MFQELLTHILLQAKKNLNFYSEYLELLWMPSTKLFLSSLLFIVLSVATCFRLAGHHQVIQIQFHENYWTQNGFVV